VSDYGDVALVSRRLITVGQQMGDTRFKTSQRQSAITRDEKPVK